MRLLSAGLNEENGWYHPFFHHPYDEAENERDALQMLAIREYDACIADTWKIGEMFPRHLRERQIDVPLIMLDPFNDISLRCRMLERGADRCLITPINKRELDAFVCALVRRCHGDPSKPVIEVGGMTIDTLSRKVLINGRNVEITIKEYEVLLALASNPKRILSKEAIAARLYGTLDVPQLKIVDAFVCRVRNKLRPHLETWNGGIITRWGRGYQIDERRAA